MTGVQTCALPIFTAPLRRGFRGWPMKRAGHVAIPLRKARHPRSMFHLVGNLFDVATSQNRLNFGFTHFSKTHVRCLDVLHLTRSSLFPFRVQIHLTYQDGGAQPPRSACRLRFPLIGVNACHDTSLELLQGIYWQTSCQQARTILNYFEGPDMIIFTNFFKSDTSGSA